MVFTVLANETLNTCKVLIIKFKQFYYNLYIQGIRRVLFWHLTKGLILINHLLFQVNNGLLQTTYIYIYILVVIYVSWQ